MSAPTRSEERARVGVPRLVRHLDLFSGIGGFALAAQMVGGIETVGFCEIDPWAQRVLAKNFPSVPIHEDVKTLNPNNYGPIDLITGGYPCQPFSYAGKRKGAEDDRHLWPFMLEIIKRARPSFVLSENVLGHVRMGLDRVLADLEAAGYSCGAIIVPACAKGAYHRRDRVWIFGADTLNHAGEQSKEREHKWPSHFAGCGRVEVAPTGTLRQTGDFGRAIEPVDRMADGLSRELDRYRGLGNAIVPQVAAEILRAILQANT
jgi:DNA (cytosine-5)-methyltransferase 1